ncbi:hypothetical protein GIB67_038342, partial [Kingdonia uniflora]
DAKGNDVDLSPFKGKVLLIVSVASQWFVSLLEEMDQKKAFCIAILEAASCGLLTVSTRVGGVPEVLPDGMVVLAKPVPSDMVKAIQKAIYILPKINPEVMYFRVNDFT